MESINLRSLKEESKININSVGCDKKNISLLKQKKPKSKCKKFKNWNCEEDNLLFKLYQIYGNKWKIIVKYFPNRTAYQLNYRMQKLLQDTVQKKDLENTSSIPETTLTETKYEYKYKQYSKSNQNFQENNFFENLETIKKLFESFKTSQASDELKSPSLSTLICERIRNAHEPILALSEEDDVNIKNLNFNDSDSKSKEKSMINNFKDSMIEKRNLPGFKFDELKTKESGQLKEILNLLGFFLKDVNNLCNSYQKIDINNNLLILQSNIITTYISLIEYMIVNEKFFM